jgi:hypothetical protein
VSGRLTANGLSLSPPLTPHYSRLCVLYELCCISLQVGVVVGTSRTANVCNMRASRGRKLQDATSLKGFVDYFLKNNGHEHDKNYRVFSPTKQAFVCMKDSFEEPRSFTRHFDIFLRRWYGRPGGTWLYVFASTLQEAIECLELLVGLDDTLFQDLIIGRHDDEYADYSECPLTNTLLEKILQHPSKRKIIFEGMSFSANQSSVLAVSPRTYIGLDSCMFEEDGGEQFLATFKTRQEKGLSPLTLHISGTGEEEMLLPFYDEVFAELVKERLDSLLLHFVHLESVILCKALAEAELPYLELTSCELGDKGSALIEAIKNGRGPKGLGLDGYEDDCDLFDNIDSFMNALRGNTYIEKLHFFSGAGHRNIPEALPAALLECKALSHLTFSCCTFGNQGSWRKLMAAVSKHPSLQRLEFDDHDYALDECSYTKRKRTRAVANMLSVNKLIDEIPFNDNTFDRGVWEALVVPRLDCNAYRKRFIPIQTIDDASTRAVVMAIALARVRSKPWLVSMLLSLNQDIICSYVDERSTREEDHHVLVPLQTRKSRTSRQNRTNNVTKTRFNNKFARTEQTTLQDSTASLIDLNAVTTAMNYRLTID